MGSARRKSLRWAFECSLNLSGKHVALLDDVMTAGAGLDELAHCIRRAGATQMGCWVIVHPLKD